MELWALLDRDRLPLGRTAVRGERLAKGEYHVVVHVCIINTKDQMLIQQRQPFKEGWPDMWDVSVGGSAVDGESSALAAERELFEEIGYRADFSACRPFFTINFEEGFDDFYILEADVDLSRLKLQYEEVQDVRWASKDDIFRMMDEGSFISYHPSVIDMIFQMRNHRGAIVDGIQQ